MSRHTPKPSDLRGKDPFSSFREWQDHRYDPGYYFEQRFPDFLRKNSLPNRYMWLLLAIGLGGVLAIVVGAPPLRVLSFLAVVCIAVGIKLAWHPPKRG
jgi:hypothetical protein